MKIDPWLTSKAAECPLCKHDCSQPFVPRILPTIPEGDQDTNNDTTSSSQSSSKKIVKKIKKLFPTFRQREQQESNNDPERQQQQQSYTEHIELSSNITPNR